MSPRRPCPCTGSDTWMRGEDGRESPCPPVCHAYHPQPRSRLRKPAQIAARLHAPLAPKRVGSHEERRLHAGALGRDVLDFPASKFYS
jgi:hypothetical protein